MYSASSNGNFEPIGESYISGGQNLKWSAISGLLKEIDKRGLYLRQVSGVRENYIWIYFTHIQGLCCRYCKWHSDNTSWKHVGISLLHCGIMKDFYNLFESCQDHWSWILLIKNHREAPSIMTFSKITYYHKLCHFFPM